MTVACIKSHFFGNIVRSNEVQIFEGICSHCDLCKDTACEFYDDTQEGTRKFIKAQAMLDATPWGHREDNEQAKQFLKERNLIIETLIRPKPYRFEKDLTEKRVN